MVREQNRSRRISAAFITLIEDMVAIGNHNFADGLVDVRSIEPLNGK